MKKIIVTLSMLMMVAFVMPAHAAGKVAVLDLQRIMKESKAAKSIRSQLESKRDQYQKEITRDEEKLRERDKGLADKRNVLSPEAFDKERKDFQKDVANVQREVQKKRIQLDQAYAKALASVQEEISSIVREMAKKHQFAITFPASQTLFYAEQLDITEEVLNRLDDELPKVTLKIQPIKD